MINVFTNNETVLRAIYFLSYLHVSGSAEIRRGQGTSKWPSNTGRGEPNQIEGEQTWHQTEVEPLSTFTI